MINIIQAILGNTETQIAISSILAVLIGLLVKKNIDYKKILPIISLIISLILKAEQTGESGVIKKSQVMQELDKHLDEKQKEQVSKKFGGLSNAIEFVFKRFGQPAIKKGFSKIFR